MGYPTREPVVGKRFWLPVLFMLTLFACSPLRQPSQPVVPVSLFSCNSVVVLPFSWEAPEDSVYIDHEREEGREASLSADALATELAKRMAACLEENGVRATVSLAPATGLEERVAALKEQGAPCVLLGRVERYEERIGSDWSVSRPASVAFKALLLETATGRVLWKGSFDEAQQPLSENLLTLKRFISRKARWVTVAVLAEGGFKGLVTSMVQMGGRPLPVGAVTQDP
ncbi:hypothetical protein [Desulfoluna sp.]|uniref:hypothetical protein n=1 Tax=Desulfoluna sp. TaxID=2045199 RepID=UPI002636A91E|nr:hypothetical protein [Desulfoluna sp.]